MVSLKQNYQEVYYNHKSHLLVLNMPHTWASCLKPQISDYRAAECITLKNMFSPSYVSYFQYSLCDFGCFEQQTYSFSHLMSFSKLQVAWMPGADKCVPRQIPPHINLHPCVKSLSTTGNIWLEAIMFQRTPTLSNIMCWHVCFVLSWELLQSNIAVTDGNSPYSVG